MTAETGPPDGKTAPAGEPLEVGARSWLVLIALSVGGAMVLLDASIVYIAIPTMADGLHTPLDQVFWIISSYTLSFVVLLLTAGRIGDRIGQRNAFAAGAALFTLASLAAGLSQSSEQLFAARVAQGVCAALMSPQPLAILATIFPARRRGAAFGVWTSITGLALLAGPVIGGIIVTYAGWRWIFFVNLPIGALIVVSTLLLVPDLRPGRHVTLEPVSLALATAALFLLTYGLLEGQPHQWGTVTTVAGVPVTIPTILVAGVVLLVPLLAWDRTRPAPLLPPALLSNRSFAVGSWVAANVTVATFGLFLLLSIFLQSALDLSPLTAALTVLPSSLVSVVASPFVGRLADRVDARLVLLGGLLSLGAGIAYIAWQAGAGSTWLTLLPGIVLAGLGAAFTYAPMGAVALRNIQPALAGAGSSTFNTLNQLGGLVGGAAVGATLQNRLAVELAAQAGRQAGTLPPDARPAFVAAFHDAGSRGLDVGPTSSALAVHVSGAPQALTAQLASLAHQTFAGAFIDAMRVTLLLPILVILAAVLSVVLLILTERRAGRGARPAGTGPPPASS